MTEIARLRLAETLNDLAIIHRLQGDFASAKQGFEQALAIWQKSGDRFTLSISVRGSGRLLLQEGDFSGARAMYEKALGIQTSARDQLNIAVTRLRLVDLPLQEALSPQGQAAKAAMQHARGLAAKSQNPEVHWGTATVAARVAIGNPARWPAKN
jgi:tetratricopeptide (TPR) repeat protein